MAYLLVYHIKHLVLQTIRCNKKLVNALYSIVRSKSIEHVYSVLCDVLIAGS